MMTARPGVMSSVPPKPRFTSKCQRIVVVRDQGLGFGDLGLGTWV